MRREQNVTTTIIAVAVATAWTASPQQKKPTFAPLALDCGRVLAALGPVVVENAECFYSDDLTTANPRTTPPDNSLPGVPPGTFAPRTDAANVPGIGPGATYPITRARWP